MFETLKYNHHYEIRWVSLGVKGNREFTKNIISTTNGKPFYTIHSCTSPRSYFVYLCQMYFNTVSIEETSLAL